MQNLFGIPQSGSSTADRLAPSAIQELRDRMTVILSLHELLRTLEEPDERARFQEILASELLRFEVLKCQLGLT